MATAMWCWAAGNGWWLRFAVHVSRRIDDGCFFAVVPLAAPRRGTSYVHIKSDLGRPPTQTRQALHRSST
jgi:hypothetical protein